MDSLDTVEKGKISPCQEGLNYGFPAHGPSQYQLGYPQCEVHHYGIQKAVMKDSVVL
jgi:hypothetical protein